MTPPRGTDPLNYTVQQTDTLAELERRVSGMREIGWSPLGGPFHNADTRRWCQAMVRKPDAPSGEGTEIVKLKEKKAKPAGDCHFSIG